MAQPLRPGNPIRFLRAYGACVRASEAVCARDRGVVLPPAGMGELKISYSVWRGFEPPMVVSLFYCNNF